MELHILDLYQQEEQNRLLQLLKLYLKKNVERKMFKMKGELGLRDPFEVERNQSALRRNENELKLDTKNELKKTHLPIT